MHEPGQDTMLVLRRCGAFHRHDNSEADLSKRRVREKLRKRLRLYDGTRTAGEVLREVRYALVADISIFGSFGLGLRKFRMLYRLVVFVVASFSLQESNPV